MSLGIKKRDPDTLVSAEFRTFKGWVEVGRIVYKGEKAMGFIEGVAVFERHQTGTPEPRSSSYGGGRGSWYPGEYHDESAYDASDSWGGPHY